MKLVLIVVFVMIVVDLFNIYHSFKELKTLKGQLKERQDENRLLKLISDNHKFLVQNMPLSFVADLMKELEDLKKKENDIVDIVKREMRDNTGNITNVFNGKNGGEFKRPEGYEHCDFPIKVSGHSEYSLPDVNIANVFNESDVFKKEDLENLDGTKYDEFGKIPDFTNGEGVQVKKPKKPEAPELRIVDEGHIPPKPKKSIWDNIKEPPIDYGHYTHRN